MRPVGARASLAPRREARRAEPLATPARAEGSELATSAAIRIDDLSRPRLPIAIRALNAVGGPVCDRLVRLDADDLLERARRRTGLDDYGDPSFLEPFRVLLAALEREADLSAFGRISTRQHLLQLLAQRLRLEDLIRRHPEIQDERIARPIIISGLPRSGTTHLFNLLSRNERLRWLPYWESLEPFPDARERRGPDGRDHRMLRCER